MMETFSARIQSEFSPQTFFYLASTGSCPPHSHLPSPPQITVEPRVWWYLKLCKSFLQARGVPWASISPPGGKASPSQPPPRAPRGAAPPTCLWWRRPVGRRRHGRNSHAPQARELVPGEVRPEPAVTPVGTTVRPPNSPGLGVPGPGQGTRPRGAAPGARPCPNLRCGSQALQPSAPVPLYLGQPARARRERNRFLEAAVILRIRKGWSCCDTREGMFAAFNFQISQRSPRGAPQDFGGKTCLEIALQESLFISTSFALRREPSGALTFRN